MEIGTTVTYLSDDMEWVTGIVTEIDGGGDPIVRVMWDGEEYEIRVARELICY